MEYLELFNDFLNKNYDGANFEVERITETDKNVFGYLNIKDNMDIPILVLDKETMQIKDEILPPFTDSEGEKTIWEKEQENEGKGMDKNGEVKIRKLLQEYGASPEEIENFMTDLYEMKDDIKDDMEDSIEEDDDFNYLDGDTMAKLKATEEGQNLIINAPKMAKDELKKAITEYLSKQS